MGSMEVFVVVSRTYVCMSLRDIEYILDLNKSKVDKHDKRYLMSSVVYPVLRKKSHGNNDRACLLWSINVMFIAIAFF